MADTIITNSPDRGGSGDDAGWAVVLIIILVVVGGIVLYRFDVFRNLTPVSNTNINVTIPDPSVTPPATSPNK